MDTTRISKAATNILYAVMLSSMIMLSIGLLQKSALDAYYVDESTSYEAFYASTQQYDRIEGGFSIVVFVVLVASYIIIGRWLYLAAKANHYRKTSGLRYSPRMCVAWYFIPIANLFKPYSALKETYRASCNIEDWQRTRTPYYFPIWWVFWLLSNFFSQAGLNKEIKLEESYNYIDKSNLLFLYAASDLAQIMCAYFLLKIISKVSLNQNGKSFELLASSQPSTPA